MLCEFASGARGTFEASRSIVGPESQMAFDVYGTAGAAGWNLETLNELRLYRVDRRPRLGLHGPCSAATASRRTARSCRAARTGSGSRTSSSIEDEEFCAAVAEERPFEPGFDGALAWVSVQDALLRSAESGRWEDVVSLREARDGADRRHRRRADRAHARRAARARVAGRGGRRGRRRARGDGARGRRRSSACRRDGVDELLARRRRRRGRDLHEHGHARRPDRRRGGAPARRSSARSRCRSTSPRSTARSRRSRRPACRSRSASTGASTRPTRRCATRSRAARSASRTSCGSRAATPRRRRSSTCASPAGSSST